jgi:DNA-3-methyladenine glycosylase
MSELFLTVLNMSITASYVILVVLLARLFLKKAPKVVSYALWSAAAFRLLIPFSLESVFSLFPWNTKRSPLIPADIVYQQEPKIQSGIEDLDTFVNRVLPKPSAAASANPLQIAAEIGAFIWILGSLLLLTYVIVSSLLLKNKLKHAYGVGENCYEAPSLKTPFVFGIFKPKIYLPKGLVVKERRYILLHENIHIRNYNGERLTVRIVETEAYCGIEDKGSHTYNDTRTPRTEVMYGPPGRAYIYLIYGMYYCLNIVTRPEGIPSAVLIRAVEPVEGLNTMSLLRYGEPYEKLDKKKRIGLTNGPGKLCMALGLTKEHNGTDLTKDEIYIARPHKFKPPDIVTTKRINIDYAEEAADYPWRFYIRGNEYVSKK